MIFKLTNELKSTDSRQLTTDNCNDLGRYNFPWIILSLLTILRLVLAGWGHLSETESYLLLCSHHLDWGFVEGPAGISALMRLSEVLLGNAPLAMRWFSPVLLLGASWILWRLTVALYDKKRAFWTVIIFNLLPLANAAGTVMEGTMLITLSWLAAFYLAWELITQQRQKNKIFPWFLFGLILAIGTQVTYQIGWLLPLVVIASLDYFHNALDAKNAEVVSSSWRRGSGVLMAISLLGLSWLPLLFWNNNHDWVQWQGMTWDSFWSWPPCEDDYFQCLPLVWALLLLGPFLVVAACYFSRLWMLESPFFLLLLVPFFFGLNELGHDKVPFALLLLVTALFLPSTVDLFFQTKRWQRVGALLLLGIGCCSVLLLLGKISSSTTQESPWNFPSPTGVIGTEAAATQLLQLRATYAENLSSKSTDATNNCVAPVLAPSSTSGTLSRCAPSTPCSSCNSLAPARLAPAGLPWAVDPAAATRHVLASANLKTGSNTSGRAPFLIAETPGLAAILGAVLPINYPELKDAPSVFIPESPALASQFLFWPHYADAITENTTPDPLYTEEKEVSPFLGHDAFYITTEKLEEIPQTISGAFSAIIPLSVVLSLQNNGQTEELKIYLCQSYQMLSL